MGTRPAQLQEYLEELASTQDGYVPEEPVTLEARTALQDKMLSTDEAFQEAKNELMMTRSGIAANQAIADDEEAPLEEKIEAQADALQAAKFAEIRDRITKALNDPTFTDEEKINAARWYGEYLEQQNTAAKEELLALHDEDNKLLQEAGINPDELSVKVDAATHARIMQSGGMQKHLHYEFQTEQAVQRAIANEGKLALKQLTMKQALRHGLSRDQYEKLLYKRMLLFKKGKLTEADLKFRGVMKSAIASWLNRRWNNAHHLTAQTTLWGLSMTEKASSKLIGHMTGHHSGARRHHGSWKDAASNPEDKAFKKSLLQSSIPRIMAQEAEDMTDNVHIARGTHEKATMGRQSAYERAFAEDQKQQVRERTATERAERELAKKDAEFRKQEEAALKEEKKLQEQAQQKVE